MNWVALLFSALQSASTQAALARHADPSARKKLRGSRVLAWVGAMLVLFGLGAVAWGVWEIRSGLASNGWPTAQGRIVESHTVEIPQPSGARWAPVIRYEYVAAGRRYVGKRVSFRESPGTQSRSEQFVAKYPYGRAVTVYYAPNDPGNAVLEPGMDTGACVRTAVLVSWPPGTGLLVLWLAARQRRSAMRELGLLGPESPAPGMAAADLDDSRNPYSPT